MYRLRGVSYITMSIGFVVAGIVLNFVSLYVFFKVGYKLGIRHEQQARLKRLNALRKMISGGL